MKNQKTFKEWKFEEAARRGCCPTNIDSLIHRGIVQRPKLIRINARVIFVIEENVSTANNLLKL